MNGDLISRSKAINGLIKCNLLGRKSCEQVADMLKNIPTSYDVGRVIESFLDNEKIMERCIEKK